MIIEQMFSKSNVENIFYKKRRVMACAAAIDLPVRAQQKDKSLTKEKASYALRLYGFTLSYFRFSTHFTTLISFSYKVQLLSPISLRFDFFWVYLFKSLVESFMLSVWIFSTVLFFTHVCRQVG